MVKKLMICPFCDDGRAFTWAGCLLHVKAKHPNKLKELKGNKEVYLTKFAADEMGNPIEPQETPAPEPTPALEPEPTPKPKEKGDPAPEGGLFHRISTSLFGGFQHRADQGCAAHQSPDSGITGAACGHGSGTPDR